MLNFGFVLNVTQPIVLKKKMTKELNNFPKKKTNFQMPRQAFLDFLNAFCQEFFPFDSLNIKSSQKEAFIDRFTNKHFQDIDL